VSFVPGEEINPELKTPLAEIAALLLSARADIVVNNNPAAANATIGIALDLVAKMEGGG
jgi:hypothetical protein